MEFTVDLGSRSYPVVLGSDMARSLPTLLNERFGDKKYTCVTNTTIEKLYGSLLYSWKKDLNMSLFTIDDGERYKTIDTWKKILDYLIDNKLERSSMLLAFGGGVVGDIAGFAAASYLRGISYVQIPTTLLAMVDSSIGGKTAVDHPKGKNLIGAFHQPSMTLVDTSFLHTLPYREFLSGYAELFKYGFIGGTDMYNFIHAENHSMLGQKQDALLEGIRRSIEIKAHVVAEDEFETKGTRALLNFGHTFAHSIERFYNFDGVLHGEAVIWGIKCACALGTITETIPSEHQESIQTMAHLLPSPELPSPPDPSRIYDYMFTDKKVSSGKLRFVLPTTPGVSIVKNDVSRDAVMAALETVFR